MDDNRSIPIGAEFRVEFRPDGDVVVINNKTGGLHIAEYAELAMVHEIVRLRKENASLRAQRNTAYGYGSDAGKPPWMLR